jgi:endonuclease/exonuclease/phosphatase (EEP) superfamily protein YafD
MKEANKGTEPATTCKLRDGKLLCHTIDYIFYTEGLFEVVGFARLPDPEELKPRYLPSDSWGSDHLALYVEVVFAEPKA